MPRRDGKGPEGLGPKTGRGLGNCDNKEKDIEQVDTKTSLETKRGLGIGAGQGRRNRRKN